MCSIVQYWAHIQLCSIGPLYYCAVLSKLYYCAVLGTYAIVANGRGIMASSHVLVVERIDHELIVEFEMRLIVIFHDIYTHKI